HTDSLNHGTMFYKAVREGLVNPGRSIQIGIRTWNDDYMGFNIRDASWVHENGIAKTLEDITKIIGDRPVYLTFDIDVLDPAFAPGTGTPAAGGLTTTQALGILRGLESVNLIGADVVEVSPPYDQSEITALAAAHVACDIVCLLASRKRAGKLP
ncbi:MAG: arginase family protein, partial [Burkholderiales bacterium]